ncbi:hypothetical protein JTE90_007806 [Oedothorax gibbosus]|uniref:Luc7-like protein 3 n=1 Tax=Oedothorax gibbosus TaxID=931172 RepID=A0AAV6VK79_9ARAC|nr:hypothetical protein JTE90_007806 [Oedothorax gibbosus]
MALFSAKQLLDELMGRDRDLGLEEKKNDFTWDGPDICKHFLAKFCPNDLFVNTKADLGVCPKIHDERLKKEYEKSSRFEKMGYEEDFLRFCQSMLSDVEKRIRRARQRLSLNNKESNVSQTSSKNNDEKANVLTERINGLLITVEKLGCEGKVEEAQGIMKLCEQLKEEREALRKTSEANHWYQTAEIAAAQEKQMEVCEVCGAFLIVGDAQQRVDDHLMGKQHVGYARLKEAVEEIISIREKERSEKEKLREKEREERRRLSREEERKREERRKARLEEERLHRSSRRTGSSRERGHRRRSRSRDRNSSHSKNKDKERSRKRSRSPDIKVVRSRSRDSGRHSKRSRSRSSEHRRDRDRRERHDKDKRERKKTDENGDSPEIISRSEDGSKGRHSSGD